MSYGSLVEGKDVDFSKFKYKESDLSSFNFEFDKITSFLTKEINQENFQSLVDSFTFLVHHIFLPIFPVNKNFLIRARANYNGEVFQEEADISYNTKNISGIKLSRFNRPTESMFYGAIPFSSQGRLLFTLLLECCKELEDKNNTSREQYFTFGKWYLKESIRVLNLCFHERCLDVNSDLKTNIDIFRGELKEKLSLEFGIFIEEYWSFLTKLACNKYSTEQQYLISTAFICTMKEYYGDKFNGIIYPSSMTGMEGVNIVLTPEAVDKYLNLKQAFMFKLARKPNNHKAFNGYQCSNVADVVDKKFAITTIY